MTAKTMPSYVNVVDQCQGTVCASHGNQLSEVYGRYSSAKAYAWERCERICAELDGRNRASRAQGICLRGYATHL